MHRTGRPPYGGGNFIKYPWALPIICCLYPLWRARDWFPAALGSPFFFGSLVFFASLVAVGIAANLRFHLCFTSKYYPTQIGAQRRRLAPWIRSADLLFALLLAIAAAAIQGIHAFWAALLLAAAVASLIAEIAIEPASANAAFGREALPAISLPGKSYVPQVGCLRSSPHPSFPIQAWK